MPSTVTCSYCGRSVEPESGRFPNHLDAKGSGLCDLSGTKAPDSAPSGPASTASEAARREAHDETRRSKAEKSGADA